jgi:aspartyl-tRNA(Asn)/glutamyl-tRNA(Gln) amidotransferase subunit B
MTTYLPIIGLEIHVELATKSKMFCGCDAAWQKYKQNENTCPVCLGMPGALPVPNKTAVEYTIKLAQALGCKINEHSHFDRKHYFYPDLPKGYQISQYDEPIGVNGEVPVLVRDEVSKSYTRKSFRIHRVHLEEDTGKLSHIGSDTVVDFNRSSVPLVEIVTEADFRSSEDVKVFLQELHTIIRTLGISEADMEQGSMRMEPNISVKEVESLKSKVERLELDELPKYKVEVKNINSFNYVKKAIDFEVKRHTEILEKGETPVQETRGWDDTKSITYSQRVKENAHDYRYFPEPDIPPMVFEKLYLETVRKSIPELPIDKVARYKKAGVKESDAILLTRDVSTSSYFDQVCEAVNRLQKDVSSAVDQQVIANALINKKISADLTPDDFAVRLVEMSKPKETDMGQLEKVVHEVIAANQKSVDDYRSGKTNAIMFLVGQVMKGMKGQADAGTVKTALEKALI